MTDETETIRREMIAQQQANGPTPREVLEKEHGQVWDTKQLQEDFEVLGFAAPLVVVRRKSDGKKGSLFFEHSPRFYYGFEEA